MRTVTRRCKYTLSADELVERSRQANQKLYEARRTKGEAKRVADGFAGQLKQLESEYNEANRAAIEGWEYRDLPCTWIEKGPVEQLLRVDNGEVVDERKLTADELRERKQVALPLDKPSEETTPDPPSGEEPQIGQNELEIRIVEVIKEVTGDVSVSTLHERTGFPKERIEPVLEAFAERGGLVELDQQDGERWWGRTKRRVVNVRDENKSQLLELLEHDGEGDDHGAFVGALAIATGLRLDYCATLCEELAQSGAIELLEAAAKAEPHKARYRLVSNKVQGETVQ